MISLWVDQLIQTRNIKQFNHILSTSTDNNLKLFAMFGKAECLRLGGKDFPINIKRAYDIYVSLSDSSIPLELKNAVIFGLADCLRVGDSDFPANKKKAWDLYQTIDNDQTPADLRQWIIYGKAECKRIGGEEFPSNKLLAWQLYQLLDNDQTSNELRHLAIYSKAMCLKVGGDNFSINIQQALQLFNKLLEINDLAEYLRKVASEQKKYCEDKIKLISQIAPASSMSPADELIREKEQIKRLKAENERLNTELADARLTQKTLLIDNSRAQLENARLKGDLSIANMQIVTFVHERSMARNELAVEEAKNKQFAEEQIFKFNQAIANIYQLQEKVKQLEEKLRQQKEIIDSQNLSMSKNDVTILAPPAPPSMQQATPDKSQPLIPAARKGAFTYNLPPASTSKRKNVEPVMTDAGDSYAGSPAKISKEAIQKNGPMMFTFHVAKSAPRQDQIEQSASKKQITPRQFG